MLIRREEWISLKTRGGELGELVSCNYTLPCNVDPYYYIFLVRICQHTHTALIYAPLNIIITNIANAPLIEKSNLQVCIPDISMYWV